MVIQGQIILIRVICYSNTNNDDTFAFYTSEIYSSKTHIFISIFANKSWNKYKYQIPMSCGSQLSVWRGKNSATE